jgi:hypothetical protein
MSSALATPQPGDWEAFDISGAGASGSVIDHMQIAYGGYINDEDAALSVHKGADPIISNTVVVNSYGDGLYVDDASRPRIANCLFAANKSYAASVSADDSTLVTGNGLATGQLSIRVRGGSIVHSGAWLPQDAPLALDANVIVAAGTMLSIDPGTQVTMLRYGSLTVRGTLKARGTASAPISFTSSLDPPKPGDWSAFIFAGAASSGSVLDYTIVSDGGYIDEGSALVSTTAGANPTFTHSVFRNGFGDGIYVGDGSRPTIAFNVFSANKLAAISLPKKDPARVHDNQLSGKQPGIQIRG